jgi:transposase
VDLVSNPRKTRAIYQHERKSDRRDALMLARIARMELALLYPVRHGSEQAQQDLLRIKLRDSLVRARVGVINSLRFTLKSLGYTIANPSTERFHKVIEGRIPEAVGRVIAPSVRALEELSLQIKLLEREIIALARSKYADTAWLEQIPGVGPITALYFVLKIQDPARFDRVRDVGAFIGLCPRRNQSGENDPQLRISKRGDAYLRRLLVSAAQYILGPFGPPSALRQYGIGIGSRRHSTREEARGGGCRSQISRAAFNSVEEQNRLSSLPRPQRRKIEDLRSGTIAMHRVKCLDFDNQIATFHSLNL